MEAAQQPENQLVSGVVHGCMTCSTQAQLAGVLARNTPPQALGLLSLLYPPRPKLLLDAGCQPRPVPVTRTLAAPSSRAQGLRIAICCCNVQRRLPVRSETNAKGCVSTLGKAVRDRVTGPSAGDTTCTFAGALPSRKKPLSPATPTNVRHVLLSSSTAAIALWWYWSAVISGVTPGTVHKRKEHLSPQTVLVPSPSIHPRSNTKL